MIRGSPSTKTSVATATQMSAIAMQTSTNCALGSGATKTDHTAI